MRTLRTGFLSVVFCAFFASLGLAGPYDHLTAPQVIEEIKFNNEMLKRANDALLENQAIAEANARELEGLLAYKSNIEARDADYTSRVDAHNSEISTYTAQCATYEVDEATYNACLGWQSGLNSRKAQLESESAQIQSQFDDYNRKAAEFNTREQARAWAGEELVRKYNEYSQNIANLQIRLNALAAVEGLQDFEQKNQECAALENLEAMHQCMQAAWDGARK